MASKIRRVNTATTGQIAPAGTNPVIAAAQMPAPVESAVVDYTDEQLLSVIPPHTCALYGDSGTGKSTMAASYPKSAEKPQLVLMFDPPSKAAPYKEGLEVVRVEDAYYDSLGMFAEACLDEAGNEVRRIEYYIDPDADLPRAANSIEARLATSYDASGQVVGSFFEEVKNYSSVVFDSMTFYQYACFRRQKYLYPMEKGKEQGQNLAWYNMVKGDVERVAKSQAPWWSTTSIFIFHTNEDKAEFASETLRGLLAVGKLPKELPAGFAEMYFSFVQRTGENYRYQVNTRHTGLWAATSIIAKAPNPCASNFRAAWANYLTTHPPKG